MTEETEAETRAERIDPVLHAAGWASTPGARVRREFICPGRIAGGGRRLNPVTADYAFEYRGQKLATLEAKKAGLGHTSGVGQAKDYSTRLKARFAFASNGIGWYEIDMVTGRERDIAPLDPPDLKDKPPKGKGTEEEGGDFDHENDDDDKPKREKIMIQLGDGRDRKIQYMASTSYWFDGKPIGAKEFLERMFGDLKHLISGEDELRAKWSNPELRAVLLTALEERGYGPDRLDDMQALIDAKDSDVFDVLAYVRFSLDPKTCHQRADTARGEGFSGYEAEMREFLREVLSAYEREGAAELGYEKLTSFLQVRYGSISDAKAKLGELGGIRGAFKQLQRYMYRD